MRKTIRIEQKTTTQDSFGEQQFAWNIVCIRRASIGRADGRELFSANERSARVPTIFITRFPRDVAVLPQMRLICDGVLYDILSAVDPDGYKAEMRIACLELTNEPTT
jgi:SPP1 family predicted phage head-tail adaptor